MKRTIAAVTLCGALLLGSVGVAGSASAQTPAPSQFQTQVTNFLNQLVSQANAFCASRPDFSLCKRVPTEAQVTNLVNRVTSAVAARGGVEAIKARIAPLKSQLCAGANRVLPKVPAQFRTQATQAVNRLCAT